MHVVVMSAMLPAISFPQAFFVDFTFDFGLSGVKRADCACWSGNLRSTDNRPSGLRKNLQFPLAYCLPPVPVDRGFGLALADLKSGLAHAAVGADLAIRVIRHIEHNFLFLGDSFRW